MGEAKRSGTFAERRANPKGQEYKTAGDGKVVDVAETSVIGRQMRRRFWRWGFAEQPKSL
jgi:hypothetical protein